MPHLTNYPDFFVKRIQFKSYSTDDRFRFMLKLDEFKWNNHQVNLLKYIENNKRTKKLLNTGRCHVDFEL